MCALRKGPAGLAAVLAAALFAGPARAADPPVAGVLDALTVAGPAGVTAGGSDALITGNYRDARAGSSVAFVGDFNRDGRQDYAIGEARRSEVDVVFGSAFPEPGATSLVKRQRIRLLGLRGSNTGWSVTGVGDMNNDGCADLVIGSPNWSYTDRTGAGTAWLVYGAPDPNPVSLSLRNPSPRVVRMIGAAGEGLGSSVARLGDLDGDSLPEIAVGAFGANAVYVISSRALVKTVDLAAPGAAAYRVTGGPGEAVGLAVAGVGDMNGDGRGELIAGARGSGGGNGAAYVVFGQPPQTAVPVALGALGAQGFALAGSGFEQAGWSVAGLGDATRDGIPDIAVGAPYASYGGRAQSGAVYIVPGRADTAPAALPNGLRIGGGDPKEYLGVSLAAVGDADGDGVADVAIGRYGRLLGPFSQAAATLALLGRLPSADADAAVLGYAGLQIAGPVPAGPPSLAGGDADADGRPDLLLGFPKALRGRGEVALVRLPAAPAAPATPAPTPPVQATNVEAVIDDSGSMRSRDPGGVLRRQALELVLVNPANQGRIFGAVQFGTFAHELFPPLRIGDDPLTPDRLLVLRRLLEARIRSNGADTNFAAGFRAAELSNPGAQARIFITDGGQLAQLTGFGSVPTYVIALQLRSGAARDRLAQLAAASGGDSYAVANAGELQAALAAIDARLRGELPLSTTVEASPGVIPQPAPAAGDEAVAKVTRSKAAVDFATVAKTAGSRNLRRARMAISWDSRRSGFRLTRMQFRRGAAKVTVSPAKLRRALRGHWQQLGRGLAIRGRTGRTFIVLDVRVRATGGRLAHAAARSVSLRTTARRTQGSYATVVRSLWTYQKRPT